MSRQQWSAVSMPWIRQAQYDAAMEQLDGTRREILYGLTRTLRGQPPGDIDEIDASSTWCGEEEVRLRELAAADLYWVSSRMVTTVADAAESLPPWTPELAIPSTSGLLLWEKPPCPPLYGTHDVTSTWDGILWWPDDEDLIQLALLTRNPGTTDHLLETRHSMPLMPFMGMFFPAARLQHHGDTSMYTPPGSTIRDDLVRVGRIVGAAWLLMGQERIADTRIQRGEGELRGADRVRRPVPDVQIIDLRRTHVETAEAAAARTVEWRQRWWVSGHWRQQPVGPGREQRRPVWIAPYIKGPDDAPLNDVERVNVLRR